MTDKQTISQMLDDVEAVTRSRFYEDPEPIASPIEMFMVRDGRTGEVFSELSTREKFQVLGDYTQWSDYQKRGIGFEQMDRVYLNVVEGKPREKWLEGTGLDGNAVAKDPLAEAQARAREAAEHQEQGDGRGK